MVWVLGFLVLRLGVLLGLVFRGGFANVNYFRAGGLLEFEALRRNISVQRDFGNLQIEAVIVMRPLDADGARELLRRT